MYRVYEIHEVVTGAVIYIGCTKLRLRKRFECHVYRKPQAKDGVAVLERHEVMSKHLSGEVRLNIREIASYQTKQEANDREYVEIIRKAPRLNVRVGITRLSSTVTHCPNGHRLTGKNLSRTSRARHCRMCASDKARANNRKKWLAELEYSRNAVWP